MPGRRIREDHAQFRDQVKDKVKSRLKDYIKSGKKVERRGDDYIVVDIPVIELPEFRYGKTEYDGVGNGEVAVGDNIGDGPPIPGEEGEGEPGDQTAEHTMGVGVKVDDYIDILGEELELPKLVPKVCGDVKFEKVKYNKIAKVGNNSLLHKKRTFKNMLKRTISTGDYNHKDISNLYPLNQDKEYKTWSIREDPNINAVIFFMTDISYSMDEPKRELIKEICWYLERWIKKFYKEVELKYIVHDVEAHEVDHEKFYKYESGGGTRISSAFELAGEIIDASYPLDEWNMYIFYFSDGENWDSDSRKCINYMAQLQQLCNIIGIGEVKGDSGWANFLRFVDEAIGENILDEGRVTTSTINTHSDVLQALQDFLKPDKVKAPF